MKIVAASATAQRQWREHFGFLDTKIYVWMHGNGKFAISICAPSEKMWRQALHPIQTYRLLYCIEFFFVTRFFLFSRYHQTAKNVLAIFFKYRARILFRFFFFAQSMLYTWTRSFCGGKESEIVGKRVKYTNILTASWKSQMIVEMNGKGQKEMVKGCNEAKICWKEMKMCKRKWSENRAW